LNNKDTEISHIILLESKSSRFYAKHAFKSTKSI